MSRQEKLAALASTGVTKAELDNIDGGTARGTTAIADGDGVLINDAGTMRMTSVETMATYMGTKIGGGMEFIASSGELSSAASASFTGFDASKYDSYVFNLYFVKPANDNQKLYAYASTNGGSSYDQTNGNYHYNNGSDYYAFNINDQQTASNASGKYGVVGRVDILKPSATAHTVAFAQTGVYKNSNDLIATAGTDSYKYSEYLSTTAVNAVQFKFGSGNIASGEITMFGIVNS